MIRHFFKIENLLPGFFVARDEVHEEAEGEIEQKNILKPLRLVIVEEELDRRHEDVDDRGDQLQNLHDWNEEGSIREDKILHAEQVSEEDKELRLVVVEAVVFLRCKPVLSLVLQIVHLFFS